MMKDKKTVVLIALLAAVLTLFNLGGCEEEVDNAVANSDIPAHSVIITIDCDQNPLFSKYDVDVYIDDTKIGTVDHGSESSFEVQLTDGQHELQLHEENRTDTRGQASFVTHNEGEEFAYRIHCESDKITVNDYDGISEDAAEDKRTDSTEESSATSMDNSSANKKTVDIKPLKDKIETLENRYEEGRGSYGYTSDSDKKWKDALEEAKALLDNENATADEITDMINRLDSAFEGLVAWSDVYEASGMESVRFGSYEQDGDDGNGAEPIEWIVLEHVDGKCLLLSKYALEVMDYHEKTQADSSNWHSCTLREWLVSEFLDRAFSQTERQSIQAIPITSNEGSSYEKTTYDEVFLLDDEQATSLLESDELRKCIATEHARAASAFRAKFAVSEDGSVEWWLIRKGDNLYVPIVRKSGVIESMRNNESAGIRPAIWVDESIL